MQRRGLVLALLATTATASADEKTERADALFNEGKALFDKDLTQACAKFEESLKFNSQAIGTLLNVALCDEKLGRYASAVAKFTEARDRASEQGMSVHLKAAEEHIAALADKVPHVTIKFSVPPLTETTIVIDEKLIPFDSIANYPIDPGEHGITVSAPGHLPHKTRFSVLAGEDKDVAVPRLDRSVTVRSSRRTIGKIVTATGLAAFGTGVVIGLVAKSRYDDALGRCVQIDDPNDPDPMKMIYQCDPDEFEATGTAHTLGTVGTVVGGIGLVAVGVGAYLWLRGPKDESNRSVSLVPQLGPESVGFVAAGRF
jgi:tetratricopeptide (TPR) repeat protein